MEGGGSVGEGIWRERLGEGKEGDYQNVNKREEFFLKNPIVNIGMWGKIISQKLAIE